MNWIPCTCPECGHEDLADAEALENGLGLLCDLCYATMQPDDE